MIYIGLNIKHLVAIKKLSQKDFGGLFGVAQSTLGGYISGRTEPPYELVVKICRHFEISLDDFITKDMSREGYEPHSGHLPLAQEPAAEYQSKDKIIELQDKMIRTLEKQVQLLEKERDSGNFTSGATA